MQIITFTMQNVVGCSVSGKVQALTTKTICKQCTVLIVQRNILCVIEQRC